MLCSSAMKIHILSDLHTEFSDFDPPETDADVVVLAGDIGVGPSGIEWAADHWLDRPVIYVAGNHEYYGHDIGSTAHKRTGEDIRWVYGRRNAPPAGVTVDRCSVQE